MNCKDAAENSKVRRFHGKNPTWKEEPLRGNTFHIWKL